MSPAAKQRNTGSHEQERPVQMLEFGIEAHYSPRGAQPPPAQGHTRARGAKPLRAIADSSHDSSDLNSYKPTRVASSQTIAAQSKLAQLVGGDMQHAGAQAGSGRDWPADGSAVHTLCTSNGSPYLNFQNRIMYATYQLAQKAPGGDSLSGFTRILHRSHEDELMQVRRL